ncbi:MAG: hypothetical protein WAK19_08995, partial [Candidatus Cybelea sp.]
AEQLQLAFDSGPDEVWCTLVREGLSNWRAALHWALTERGDVLLGQRLVGQLNVAWRTFARVEGRRWIALALELVDNRTPRSVLAGLAYCEATVSWQLREYQRSLTTCEDAITHYRTVGDSLGVAHAQAIATVARYFILLDRAIVVIVTHDRRPLANQPVKVRGTFSQLFGGSRRNEGPRELKSICVHL